LSETDGGGETGTGFKLGWLGISLAGTSRVRPGPVGDGRVDARANRGGLCAGPAAAVRHAHPTARMASDRAESRHWLGSRGGGGGGRASSAPSGRERTGTASCYQPLTYGPGHTNEARRILHPT
jgi:hypothetical protein